MPLRYPTSGSVTDQWSHPLCSEVQHCLCTTLVPGCSQPVAELSRDTQAEPFLEDSGLLSQATWAQGLPDSLAKLRVL